MIVVGYTRNEILERLEDSASRIALFYKEDFINYRGKTTDTKEDYTEVISEWLLSHIDLLEEIPTITRETSYCMDGHDGIPDNPNSIREEELIAMAMKRQGELPIVGKVLDYQTPLKNVRTDRAGKIDLLAYDSKTLRILELKEPDSKETMLRCVLEGYTYLKTVDQEKLLQDFEIPKDTPVEASPFVFYGVSQWDEMQQERPFLKKLMAELNSKPFYIQENNKKYIVVEE